MDDIKVKLRLFNKVRDWDQFHTPENLAKSISIEAAELLECFQWTNQYDIHAVSDEVADIVMYCIMFADKINIDLKKEILRKLDENNKKYPVLKCKGSSRKYNKI